MLVVGIEISKIVWFCKIVKISTSSIFVIAARCLRGLEKLPSKRAAAVSKVDLFLGVLSDPALTRSEEVSEFEMLACLATLGDP